MTAQKPSPGPWSYEYNPYRVRREPDSIESELAAFEVFDAEGDKVFDTNEDTDAGLQEANARLGSSAPRMLATLIACANLLADYEEAEGEEGDAYRDAMDAIAEATGRPACPSYGERVAADEGSLHHLLCHLDRAHIVLEEFGCFVALCQDRTSIFWCPMNADGTAERDRDNPPHMNWSEVTAPDHEFLDKVNAVFGTSFDCQKFSGR
jgi:hypothetical protein